MKKTVSLILFLAVVFTCGQYLFQKSEESAVPSVTSEKSASSGTACDHDPDYTFSGDGVPSGYCRKCNAYIYPATNGWRYLSSMEVIYDSIAPGSIPGLIIGNWEDPVGAVYWEALRFRVVRREGWSSIEYICYRLDGSDTTLSGTIVSSPESDPNANMRVDFYLDSELIYTCEDIGYYSYVPYMLDIRGGNRLEVVCSTDTDALGYCVVTGALF